MDIETRAAGPRDIHEALARGGKRGEWTTIRSYDIGVSAGLSVDVRL